MQRLCFFYNIYTTFNTCNCGYVYNYYTVTALHGNAAFCMSHFHATSFLELYSAVWSAASKSIDTYTLQCGLLPVNACGTYTLQCGLLPVKACGTYTLQCGLLWKKHCDTSPIHSSVTYCQKTLCKALTTSTTNIYIHLVSSYLIFQNISNLKNSEYTIIQVIKISVPASKVWSNPLLK